MSQWFDVLYRRRSENKIDEESKKNPSTNSVSSDKEQVDSSVTEQGKGDRRGLKRAPALSGIPSRWSLEVQKIVFHLRPDMSNPDAPRNIVFSGVQRGPGVSTICYLVAHHLATEGYQNRVLYVNFNPAAMAPVMQNADATFQIGQELSESEVCIFDDSTLTTVAIRSENKQAVSIASGWLYEFIAHAKTQFDWILVDAPPFFASPETYSVARACDGVVLVLKSGETRYPALKALVADLNSLGIPIMGTVLNFRQYPLPKWLLRYV